ncbi:flagellar biosynthesis protein FlgN [Leptospira perolatii]|uniref:Flagellar biosynthesis protein FlgN n=1 Tax=Leptospira perolatii TaxID=2023191 RepID=A0A2M9ZKL3_9LEPT|nr:flagellar protein FlgN [Leptospira perolatii]PJZ70003.1 flagellar biosynthesis protein FlgN [Leptospira perolatii]PJZ72589.1 flagellar biosynthesis protein FlgN [Leptospira perolatii]
MAAQKEEWLDRISSLFEEEIHLYSEILKLEIDKTDAVTKADGKSLERISKKTYELIVHASELERVRMQSIEDVFKTERDLQLETDSLTLSDFLNRLDRTSGYKLKQLGTRLKDIVHKLKDRIKANDKLLQTRQAFLQATIEAMRENSRSGEVATYGDEERIARSKKKRSSVLVNASV